MVDDKKQSAKVKADPVKLVKRRANGRKRRSLRKQWALDVEAPCIEKHMDKSMVSARAPACHQLRAPRLPASCYLVLPRSSQKPMLNQRVTPDSKATGANGGVAGVVLLTPEFFAKFPDVRFFLGPNTNPMVYKYVDGALEQEVAAPVPKRRRSRHSTCGPRSRRVCVRSSLGARIWQHAHADARRPPLLACAGGGIVCGGAVMQGCGTCGTWRVAGA